MRIRHLLGSLLAVLCLSVCDAQANGTHHNQNVVTNNGVNVQVNIQQSLRSAARASQVDERGWMSVLLPAHDKTPPDSCQWLSRGETTLPLTIFLGSGNIARCTSDICRVVGPTSSSKPDLILSVTRVKGVLLLYAKVFDAQGDLVANVDQNRPHVNRNFVSDWSRPDASSISIRDNHDQQVLYARLLNKDSLYIEGEFYAPNSEVVSHQSRPGVRITKDVLTLLPNGLTTEHSCLGNNYEAIGLPY